MRPSKSLLASSAVLVFGAFVWTGPSAFAQVTPAAGYTGADDTPTVKVGVTIFTDYTYTDAPTLLDADGNEINPAAFDVKRAYINVTGSINHLVAYRITPDITRESGSGGNLDGSLTFRLKYAYGQFNLDDAWASKGSWVRLGEQQTPYVDYMENIYRYRFQGPIFTDAEKYLTSSDFGLSTHYNFAGNHGDVHGGYYNGNGYSSGEVNDQQALQIRATLRPVPNGGMIKGLRLTAFYDADHYVRNDSKSRLVLNATFEHKYVNAGIENVSTTDQPLAASAEVKGEGWSVWATPRSTKGWEGLLRWDSLKPDKDVDAKKERKVAGVAYWFTALKPAAAALLLDYEHVTYDELLAKPNETRYALHALFNF
jgi:hypothetical protein